VECTCAALEPHDDQVLSREHWGDSGPVMVWQVVKRAAVVLGEGRVRGVMIGPVPNPTYAESC